MAYYSKSELESLGLASCGEDVHISDKCSIYHPERISIGNHVRIDDFCVLSAGDGGIEIGDYVHIAVYSSLIGKGKITLSDFSGLSSRVSIYSSNDDYSGEYLTNPTVPDMYTGVTHADVFLGRHAIVGSGSIILPGVAIEDGVAIAALSLVTKSCSAFGIYSGNRRIGERKQKLLILEQAMLSSVNSNVA
jgi:dTDP-4-amino-4,6-dideoxy-D-glucose acyltransferase